MRRVLLCCLFAGILLCFAQLSGEAHGEAESQLKKATFGAGCFWGVEKVFAKVPGVVSTRVGYAGGGTKNPGYREVCTGRTGHAEAVEVTYDPAKVSYEDLLVTFWEWHDPTTLDRQGPDIGSQYRSVIFTHDQEQEEAARRAKETLEKAHVFPGRIVTEIEPAGEFYTAEEYHQKYLEKNPGGYCSHFLHPEAGRIRQLLKGR